MDQGVLISILVFLLITQAVMLVGSAGRVGEREKIAQRLSAYTLPPWEGRLPTSISVLRRRRYSRLPWLDRILARFDLGDGIALELQQAGLPLRAGEFLFIQLMLATILGLAGALLGWQAFGGPAAALAGGLIGFVAPLVWLRYRVGQRRNAFEHGLPEALDRVTGALRAGYGLEYGFDLVAREGSRLRATAVAAQGRTGGNLVEVLGQMTQMLREGERLRRDVRVITTAPRVSGYVVALLPLLTVVAMYLTSRYYIETLLSEPIGRLAAAAGFGLVLVGLFMSHRIAKVDL